MTNYKVASGAIASILLMIGCGGGGGGSTATPSASATIIFPLQAGYMALISKGATDNFTVSGSCNGSATQSASAPGAAIFEGISGFSATTTATINFTDCTPSTNAVTGTSYWDSNYTPLGSAIPGVEYAKFASAPPTLPAYVKVGDTAIFATLNTYQNSTKSVATGQRYLSYVVEADTSTSAIVNLITKSYNASNQLLFTQQSRYKIVADGTLSIMSIDIQYSLPNTNHLVMTKK